MQEESIQLPQIKMEGRSGCKLDVVKEGFSCYNKEVFK
jgi:hypothetical protein